MSSETGSAPTRLRQNSRHRCAPRESRLACRSQAFSAAQASAVGTGPLELSAVGSTQYVLTTRSEEHTSELQSLMRTSYAVFCLKKTKTNQYNREDYTTTNKK